MGEMADPIGRLDDAKEVAPQAAAAPAWSRHAGWLSLVLLLVAQYGLFRQYAEREVTWAYPGLYDQTVYLAASYETYEHILNHGLIEGTWSGLERRSANGMLLPVQASLMYLLL